MSRSFRSLSLVLVAGAIVSACSEQSSVTAPGRASFVKSGTAPSGGGSKSNDSSSTQPTSPTGEPIAPNYVGKITKMGVVPAGFYYGSPTGWEVNGYAFAAGYLTSYKPANGPIVLGACVSVTFTGSGVDRFMTEMKTQSASKCP